MEFDLFYEVAVPAPAGRDERQVFADTLAELEVADRLGFGTAWFVEHHFMRGYSHSAAPDLILAAASQRTQRLRLGQAVALLPHHHPLHVAERLATLDVLSQGRIEFGFGRGFSPREYAAFASDMASARGRMLESLAILRQSFAPGPVNFAGAHFRVEDIDVVPRVLQRPHPPLWLAAVSPESFTLAAALGVGVLVGPFKPWFMVRADIARYRAAWAQQAQAAPARVAMTLGVFCLPDGARARALAKRHLTWFYRELLATTRPVLERLIPGYEHYRRIGRARAVLPAVINLPALEALGLVIAGDPAHCRTEFARLQAAGVDRVLCAIAAGGAATADVVACMQTLAREVLPQFKSGDTHGETEASACAS